MSERRWTRALAALGLALAFACGAATNEAPPVAADPKLEARVMAIAAELRCLVCQNQTIADSHAELAQDLRNEIRTMLAKGQGEREILDFMTQRYGDFVLYRPPFNSSTALLWVGPALLLVLALGVLVAVLRRRQRLADDAFEPEPQPETDDREIVADAQRR